MNGYKSKILCVDLTRGHCEDEFLPDELYYRFLSGTGLAARLLYDRIPSGADALGPENILAFASGLLTGTGSLFTGRWMVAAKSPLTGTWGEANCGGNLSPAIKQCGYDAILFSGKSREPVYLLVDNKGPTLVPAGDLWGKDTLTTEEILIQQTKGKKKPAIACIGPAGEKLSLISGICNQGGRIAARCGLGAVMGSKNLKAVVLAGSRPIAAADEEGIKELSKKCAKRSKGFPLPPGKYLALFGKFMGKSKVVMRMPGLVMSSFLGKWGTSGMNQFSVEWGDSPIKNWLGSSRDYPCKVSKKIEPERVIALEKQKFHCYSCPLGCGGICSMPGKGEQSETHKPEYESIMAFGGFLLHNDLESIFHINDVLNRAGMDTISAGCTVGFAMECWEKGLITAADTGGIDLSWGNTKGIVAIIEQMVKREGFGDILADGSEVAAEKIGKGSTQFSITAGRQEIPMHDPRNDPGFGLHASVEPTPGRHTSGAIQYYELYALWKKIKHLPKPGLFIKVKDKFTVDREKAIAAVANSSFTHFYNGVGLCFFGALIGVDRVPVFEWVNAATGWQRTPGEYMEIGKRIQTLKQLFNIKQGVDPLSFKAKDRSVGRPPLAEGPNKGRSFDLDQMMKYYFEEIGWNPETGHPLAETIEKLGLKDVSSHKSASPSTGRPMAPRSSRLKAEKGKKPVVDKKHCISCGVCIQSCPVSCLELSRAPGKNAHPYPVLPDPGKCIGCRFCEAACPVEVIAMN